MLNSSLFSLAQFQEPYSILKLAWRQGDIRHGVDQSEPMREPEDTHVDELGTTAKAKRRNSWKEEENSY